jgi:hypothetical protein
VIRIFYDNHNPPHFHAEYGEHEVLVNINTLAILGGNLPARALGLVTDWASLHQRELLAAWERASRLLILKVDRRINFAMQQNDVPVVKAVHVENGSDSPLRDPKAPAKEELAPAIEPPGLAQISDFFTGSQSRCPPPVRSFCTMAGEVIRP